MSEFKESHISEEEREKEAAEEARKLHRHEAPDSYEEVEAIRKQLEGEGYTRVQSFNAYYFDKEKDGTLYDKLREAKDEGNKTVIIEFGYTTELWIQE